MREPVWRWALEPLPPDASRRELRDRLQEVDALEGQMRWIWNEFCSGVDLTHRIVPPGFETREPPRLGPIHLGPPTRFNVELRPGQLPRDLLDVRDRLAAAYQVDDIDVRPLAPGWVKVILVERVDDRGDVVTRVDSRQEPGLRRGEVRASGRHFPRRRRRGPTGGSGYGP